MDKYFKSLGLEIGASKKQIKNAYRRMVRQWHPDKFTHDLSKQIEAQERLKEINEAYRLLKNCYPPKNLSYEKDIFSDIVKEPNQAQKDRRFDRIFWIILFSLVAVVSVYRWLH